MQSIFFLFNPHAIKLRHVLINDFASKGFNVSIALPSDLISTWQNKCPGVKFVRFDEFSGTSIGVLNNLKTLFKIRSILKKEKPDAVFFGNVKPNIYGGLAAKSAGIKNVYGLVSGLGYAFIEERGLKRSLIRYVCEKLYKLSFKRFTHVFFQNIDDRDLFIRRKIVNEKRSSVVNGTGVDLQLFKQSPLPQQLTFFMAARLIREKGVFHFVEAAKILKQKYPNVKFVLGGNIDTNPSAITQQQLSSYKNHVDYIGYVQDMAEAMQACSVFVYPSYYREGVPRSLLEALACGRPVITTDSVGCREVVIDGINGFKIATKSTDALVVAMENFIKCNECISKMGNESRLLAEKRFDIHKVNDDIYEIVKSYRYGIV